MFDRGFAECEKVATRVGSRTLFWLELTSDVQSHRVADAVALDVVCDTGVDARLMALSVLKYQTLVTDNDPALLVVKERVLLHEKGGKLLFKSDLILCQVYLSLAEIPVQFFKASSCVALVYQSVSLHTIADRHYYGWIAEENMDG